MKAIITVLMLFCAALSAEEMLQFRSDAERQLFHQLTAELRCPQCQNQNIADSNAIVAVDMRQKTYELVRQGQDRQQVLDYMINRYGDFVHYQPPLNRYTVWLWLTPVLLLLLLLGIGVYRRASQQANANTAADDGSDSAELDKLIARYRSKKP
ncbi:MAG: cytochrome c-type biogenesis protein CcmH [Gammaproteobacteria bacterium]|nr:cytochrome c-type biogenesis protein CcmH [Gammaproteobacteria bacterium]MBU1553204.1 cytochrome c-type biogenesis protein CcmH [Gammaproteobacteria bacterium]MBU2069629.1 cytochrome c-type biogenesis protein CcmH [Gammaproteobacteria bacterium]MBU2184494.1 cytochrome c-type biogenesis protein CcmH [Gammaproteobacteria bacterium]MBU2205176.1 cytochrome c-type biogenesis protein CcmH [Gammaproteobacteria bacterium]